MRWPTGSQPSQRTCMRGRPGSTPLPSVRSHISAKSTALPGGDSLQQRVQQVIGELAHLADAATDDPRAVRATGEAVADLARHMLEHSTQPVP